MAEALALAKHCRGFSLSPRERAGVRGKVINLQPML
jgi:hypothetical protein